MGDFRLPPCSTLVVGMTGSGKTTFALRYLLNVSAACRFIFDDLGRAATRLRLTPARTANELERALETRWVVFNPHVMFPGDTQTAFRFFCQWIYDTSRRAPGKKVFLVDELWQFCTPSFIPREFTLVTQAGREEGIELFTCTQMPQRINESVTGQATELVCFRLAGPKALERVTELEAEGEVVAALPLMHFVSYNRLTGGKLSGKL